jgi:acetyl esterase/lipase
VSILARDRKGPAIAKQILVMPMLDDRTLTPDPQLAPFVVWSWDDNRTGWQALLGSAAGGPDTPAYAAPARVADPAGLPPAYIEVGQLDIFHEPSTRTPARDGRRLRYASLPELVLDLGVWCRPAPLLPGVRRGLGK